MPPNPTLRPQEVVLMPDPAERADATLAFIGVIRSPWQRENCPKNLTQARLRDAGRAVVEIQPEFCPGLTGLAVGDLIWLLLWFDRARRDIILQAPAHAEGLRGAFALRSPVRPNPIAMEAVQILAIDHASGRFEIDATDGFDGTPVLDIKPWRGGIDIPPTL